MVVDEEYRMSVTRQELAQVAVREVREAFKISQAEVMGFPIWLEGNPVKVVKYLDFRGARDYWAEVLARGPREEAIVRNLSTRRGIEWEAMLKERDASDIVTAEAGFGSGAVKFFGYREHFRKGSYWLERVGLRDGIPPAEGVHPLHPAQVSPPMPIVSPRWKNQKRLAYMLRDASKLDAWRHGAVTYDRSLMIYQGSRDWVARLNAVRFTGAEWWIHYKRYLSSPDWNTRYLRVMNDWDWTCQWGSHFDESQRQLAPGCLGSATEVHHLHYESVGCEHWGDVAALCSPCHAWHHDQKNYYA